MTGLTRHKFRSVDSIQPHVRFLASVPWTDILKVAANMSREVWFQLVDGQGNPIGTVGFVRMPFDEADVADVRDAVKMYYSDSHLVGIAPTDLIVFANRAAYDTKQALEEDSPIGSHGGLKQNALIVQMPLHRRAEMDEEPAQKKIKQSIVITYEQMNSIGHNWISGGDRLVA